MKVHFGRGKEKKIFSSLVKYKKIKKLCGKLMLSLSESILNYKTRKLFSSFKKQFKIVKINKKQKQKIIPRSEI